MMPAAKETGSAIAPGRLLPAHQATLAPVPSGPPVKSENAPDPT